MAETVKHTPDICNRLRGVYRVPITDGLGATGGGEEPDNPDEFVRRFPSVPIQERAAGLIDEMLIVLRETCAVFDLNHEGEDEYNPDLASDLWKNSIHEKLRAAIDKAEAAS